MNKGQNKENNTYNCRVIFDVTKTIFSSENLVHKYKFGFENICVSLNNI